MGFNDLGKGKVSVGVEKLLGIAAGGALRSMAPEVTSVINLAYSPEEIMGVSGWGRWSSGFQIVALAANFGRFQIRNPVGSGVIVVVESVLCAFGLVSTFAADGGYATTTDLTTTASQDFRDGRTNPRGRGIAIVSHERNAAAVTATSLLTVIPANSPLNIPALFPILLMPGNAYLFGCGTANDDVYATVAWRERGATPAELGAS